MSLAKDILANTRVEHISEKLKSRLYLKSILLWWDAHSRKSIHTDFHQKLPYSNTFGKHIYTVTHRILYHMCRYDIIFTIVHLIVVFRIRRGKTSLDFQKSLLCQTVNSSYFCRMLIPLFMFFTYFVSAPYFGLGFSSQQASRIQWAQEKNWSFRKGESEKVHCPELGKLDNRPTYVQEQLKLKRNSLSRTEIKTNPIQGYVKVWKYIPPGKHRLGTVWIIFRYSE